MALIKLRRAGRLLHLRAQLSKIEITSIDQRIDHATLRFYTGDGAGPTWVELSERECRRIFDLLRDHLEGGNS